MNNWNELKFWNSGEWQVIEERLDAYVQDGILYNPSRERLFHALEITPFECVRVAIIGQDPYPDYRFCTGVAFSTAQRKGPFPQSLENIYKVYSDDLHYDKPKGGSLEPWCRQGVLLWNAVPTCFTNRAGSHREWTEWTYLTQEIVERLSEKGIVFVLLGVHARNYLRFIDSTRNSILSYSHPSPLSFSKGANPFQSSRMFSTINDKLKSFNQQPIDWKLK